jgi:pimeloyl-ACP methyl ester carboxylesterase
LTVAEDPWSNKPKAQVPHTEQTIKLTSTKDGSDMSTFSHQTADTKFIEANGITFAYRRFGNPKGVPLVFNAYLMGNLDSWDPAVTDGLARGREVILFNNTGVASSSGDVPSTFAEMAKDATLFIDALGLDQVDLLGYSIGSMVSQEIALQRPDLVRRMILVGSGPRNGHQMPLTAKSEVLFSTKFDKPDDLWMHGLFTTSSTSQTAGHEFLKRRDTRQVNRDIAPKESVMSAQFSALIEWSQPYGERFAYLKHIKMPVLVVNGTADFIFDPQNSFILAEELPSAQLILYPDSSHGSLFQYPTLFVQHSAIFLHE